MSGAASGAAGGSSDGRAIDAMAGVVRVFRNTTSWYHNASFLLPLIATIVVGLAGVVTRKGELIGFSAFLAVVTLAMTPVVLAAWRRTATAIVVTEDGVVSLHAGSVLKSLRWREVTSIRRRETQGNLRWEIGAEVDGRLLLDGELEDLDGLVRLARRLAGVAPDCEL